MAFNLPKLLQRSAIPDNIPQKVFVEPIVRATAASGLPGWGTDYEYSTDYPAHLHPTGFDMEAIIEDMLYGHYSDYNFIRLFYSVPEIFAPVNEIASRVADTVWQLRKIRKTGGIHDDEVIYTDSGFNRLFSEPNSLCSFKDFVYQSVCYELLTGKCYQYAAKSKLLPDGLEYVLSLWNFPVCDTVMEIKQGVSTYTSTSINDFILRYVVNDNGVRTIFDPNDVLPFLHLDLHKGNNPKYAISPLCGAKAAIKNLIAVYMARGKIYMQQGPLGMFVSNKSDETGNVPMTTSEKAEFLNDLHSSYGLTGRRSIQGVTRHTVEYVKTGDSIKDLEPFNETLQDAVCIYATLRVPRHLVPSKDHSTYANASSDLKSFYSDTIIPMANRYAEKWTNFFKLRDKRQYIHADFSHIDVLQENKKEKSEVEAKNTDTHIKQFLLGVKTLNDCLTATGADENSNPLYNKYLPDMTAQELDILRNAGVLKTINTGTDKENSTDNSENSK